MMSDAHSRAVQLDPTAPAAGSASRPRGRPRRTDQRGRLLSAIVAVVGERGYARAKIGEIAARAGVSRATFYDQFADKEDCFVAAHRDLGDRTAAAVEATIERAEPARAAQAAIVAIGALAQQSPDELRFLTHEALLAGPSARRSHDELLGRLEEVIERCWQRAPSDALAPNVPAKVLVGGAVRLLGIYGRRSGPPSDELLADLTQWVDCYDSDEPGHLRRDPLGQPRVVVADGSDLAPPVWPRTLPRGRHRLPKDQVDAIQRERIAYGAARVTEKQEPGEVAVSDIVAAAGVSREVFYAHFRDKEHAFLASHQLIFESLMGAASGAFFMPGMSWPERVWSAGESFAGLLAAMPSFAHYAFVSAYGIGEIGVRRVDEAILGFGLFLEEGYRQRPQGSQLPHVVSDAIATAIAAPAAYHIRNGETHILPALLPVATYTALAPFMGPRAAGEQVDRLVAQCSRFAPQSTGAHQSAGAP
jgi:AcrR family transcriptional regulator